MCSGPGWLIGRSSAWRSSGDQWDDYVRSGQPRDQVRPEQANQYGRLYPAVGGGGPLIVLGSIPGPGVPMRRVTQRGIEMLEQHGIAMHLEESVFNAPQTQPVCPVTLPDQAPLPADVAARVHDIFAAGANGELLYGNHALSVGLPEDGVAVIRPQRGAIGWTRLVASADWRAAHRSQPSGWADASGSRACSKRRRSVAISSERCRLSG